MDDDDDQKDDDDNDEEFSCLITTTTYNPLLGECICGKGAASLLLSHHLFEDGEKSEKTVNINGCNFSNLVWIELKGVLFVKRPFRAEAIPCLIFFPLIKIRCERNYRACHGQVMLFNGVYSNFYSRELAYLFERSYRFAYVTILYITFFASYLFHFFGMHLTCFI